MDAACLQVRMDAVRQVFVDNRQKAMAAHEDSMAPGGLHIMDMTVTNGGGRPRQACSTACPVAGL